ncbi:MAG: energy transducer TonB [Candidatus Poribacteria bacterium]|nr:energy transducer TonB [Candidatus Poribacteria bacterium]
MKSGQSNSTEHLGSMRQRRVNRMKRQRAIEAGKPIDVSLKTMTLNSVQKNELSALQPRTHDSRHDRVAARSRLSVLGSLAIHAIAVFIAAFYVVRTAQVDDDAFLVGLFDPIPEKRKTRDRDPIVKPKPLPTEPLKPIVLPVPKVPVRPITSDGDSTLGDTRMAGAIDSGPVADASIKTGGLAGLGGVGPIKPPTVVTGDPMKSFSERFDDTDLGITSEPLDVDHSPSIDPSGGDAFKPTEILRSASFRYKAEPKYPSEAKRAGKQGKVVLEATIDADGKVKDIKVKEDTVGFGCARAAIQALKASRFIPAKRGGENVAQRITVPYTFKIED